MQLFNPSAITCNTVLCDLSENLWDYIAYYFITGLRATSSHIYSSEISDVTQNMFCHMAGLLVNMEKTAPLCLFPGINTIRISSINMDFMSPGFETHSKEPVCQMTLTARVMCCQILK